MNFEQIISIWWRYSLNRVTRKIDHGKFRELVWTILPTIILVLIAIPSIKLLYFLDHPIAINENIVFTYKIIGHQWYWSYEYFKIVNFNFENYEFDSYLLDEQTIFENSGLRLLEVDNPLIMPLNVGIRLLITAIDVLHSWSVPSLGVKMDAVPGRLNQVCFIIKRPGEFYGQCSEICGINHGFMPIKVIGVEIETLNF